jgi:hypothetical protein
VNQLSADDKDLKSYLGRPVSNLLEMMPWDCSLNKDLKDTVLRHVCYTCHLPEEDDRKFSLLTQTTGTGTYDLWYMHRYLVPDAIHRYDLSCRVPLF